jgi:hypothetical protein
VVRLRLCSLAGGSAPRLVVEFRDQSGLLLGSAVKEAAEWDWPDGAGERHVVLRLDRLPLADGRFHVGVALVEPSSSRLYHHVERAAEFLVYPLAGTRGLVSFEARWELHPEGNLSVGPV